MSDGEHLYQRLVDLALGTDRCVSFGISLICIDGKAGAGKTTLTSHLSAELTRRGVANAVVHMDDLYAGWGGLLTVRDVVVKDLLEPLSDGGRARYRHFDWEQNAYTHTVTVPEVDVVLLEGCGSAPPEVDPVASLVIFIEAPDDLRLARGLARDGLAARAPWIAFMADEERLAQRDRTRDRAEVVLNEEGEVVRWPTEAAAATHGATGKQRDRLSLHVGNSGEDR